ncbi:MAG TPA: transcriptional regulator [Syntrophomonas sp.]|jgi:ArsR family transcriptional regulator|nr:transcriptional regulator [Syntrophomonas sp.]HCF70706.1 transcriptional regulator [Syntrophomonas sp.]
MDLVVILKALSDENRLRILNLLRNERLCVGELETVLNMTQSNVSRHLIKLRNIEMITQQKKAQWVYYQINHSFKKRHPILLEFLYKELDKMAQCKKDLDNLSNYKQKLNPELENALIENINNISSQVNQTGIIPT